MALRERTSVKRKASEAEEDALPVLNEASKAKYKNY